MSAPPRRLRWFPLAALALLLASILALLYSRTQMYDSSAYFRRAALLGQLKQVDAQRELDAMKSNNGSNRSYDPLTAPLVELDALWEQLQALVADGEQANAARLLTGRSAAFHAAILEKSRLIESFKSHNAVLRNSQAFLPVAADDVQHAIVQTGRGDQPLLRRTAMDVNALELASLEFSLAASNEAAAEIRAALVRLAAARPGLPAEVAEAVDLLIAHVQTIMREQPAVTGLLARIAAVPVAARIDDIHNVLRSEQQRTEAQAERYRKYLLMFAAALIALFLYAVIRLVRSYAVINRVNQELREGNEQLEQRVRERTSELRAAQSELVATARQAGKAEIATNVLHNVGNVLNSVTVAAGVIADKLHRSKSLGLSKTVQLLDQHGADLGGFLTQDEKGKLVPAYLGHLAGALAEERQQLLDELGQLSTSIEHIKEIVLTQQSYAGASTMVEPVQIRDLIEDALRIDSGAPSRHQVTVVREFEQTPVLALDKHRVLLIIINLISNARHAMDKVPGGSNRLTLRVAIVDGAALRISVIDEGEGIAQENLTRIFAHGFTTRKGGHGFGLHSCVNAAREMNGTLTAISDGPGQGATFVLELPLLWPQETALASLHQAAG